MTHFKQVEKDTSAIVGRSIFPVQLQVCQVK